MKFPIVDEELETVVEIFDKLNKYCIEVNPTGTLTKECCKNCVLCQYKYLDDIVVDDCIICLYAYALVKFIKKGGVVKEHIY